jgi:hypothetical protein
VDRVTRDGKRSDFESTVKRRIRGNPDDLSDVDFADAAKPVGDEPAALSLRQSFDHRLRAAGPVADRIAGRLAGVEHALPVDA